jgi:hypothetical protein
MIPQVRGKHWKNLRKIFDRFGGSLIFITFYQCSRAASIVFDLPDPDPDRFLVICMDPDRDLAPN